MLNLINYLYILQFVVIVSLFMLTTMEFTNEPDKESLLYDHAKFRNPVSIYVIYESNIMHKLILINVMIL